jgi:hypothetical protein
VDNPSELVVTTSKVVDNPVAGCDPDTLWFVLPEGASNI